MSEERTYDLEERLLTFSADIIRLIEHLPNTLASNHIAKQLVRSGTSPYANHGEAQAAESPADFVHKLKICLKELRETMRWLRLLVKLEINATPLIDILLKENEELIKIFVASIRTANINAVKNKTK